MQWDWGRTIELGTLIVMVLTLHLTNLHWASRTRDQFLERMTSMEQKLALMYGWFKRNVVRGSATESDDKS